MISNDRERGGLKHLSTRRKRQEKKSIEIPLLKAIERGIGQTESLPKGKGDVEL